MNYRKIPLTQGLITTVDTEDYEYLSKFKWHAYRDYNTFYARRTVGLINRKKVNVLMHHAIIGRPPPGYVSDHKDGNGINNRRLNLRHVTHRQNSQNIKNIKLTSQFSGVSWHKSGKKWEAYIEIAGKKKHLGLFNEESDAATAYKDALETIGEVSVEDL